MKSLKFPLRLLWLLAAVLFFAPLNYAQVGIGTTSPNAGSIIDVESSNKGMLIPRLDIADLSTIAPVTGGSAESLLVYNTNTTTGPGFFYWNGTQWIGIDGQKDDDWNLGGNGGTTPGFSPGQSFIGTTDNVDFVVATNSSEAMRVLSGGAVSVNDNTPIAGDRFTVVGNSGEYAINGYTSGAAAAVYGFSANSDGVVGIAAGAGLYGDGNALGLFANSAASAGALIRGQGVAIGYYTGAGLTVHGEDGAITRGDDAVGHGLIAAGNSLTPTSLVGGTGVSAIGEVGVFGYSATSGSNGVIGGTDGSAIATDINGSGVAGSGPNLGVFGYCPDGTRTFANRGNAGGRFTLDSDGDPTTTNSRANATLAGFDNIGFNDASGSGYTNRNSYFGGYFSGGSTSSGTPSYAYAGLRYNTNASGTSGTDFKIVGPGSNSTIFRDEQGTPRIMFSPEAPEILFQDFGTGQLVNGQVRIEIDPLLQAGLHVDSEHPLKVYITLEGECNGVYVTNKSVEGFTVKELAGGTSNAPFSWQIVANRADTMDSQGNVQSKHVGIRLPEGPGPLNYESKKVDTKTSDTATSNQTMHSLQQYRNRGQGSSN